MAEEGQGSLRTCPGCKEEVEEDWVKCPVCNTMLKGIGTSVPPGPPKVAPPVVVTPPFQESPKPAPQTEVPGIPEAPPAIPPPPSISTGAEEARRISESAAAKSKLEASLKERDERIKDLEQQLNGKDAQVTSTEQALAVERMEKASLKKKLDEIQAAPAKQVVQSPEVDELKSKLEETNVKLDQEVSERKALEELVVQREGDLKKKEEDLKLREDAIVAKEKKAAEDRDKVKAQAVVLADVENKVDARDKAIKEREAALAKDEAALDQVEASLKERETAVVHGHEQLKTKQGELDSMIDEYAKKLAQIRLREDKVAAMETKNKELAEKNEKDRTELGQARVQVETEKAEINTRSQGLFERLHRTEAKIKELETRENALKEAERKSQKWQEDLRHTELHLMSIQEEIDSCVHCSAKERFSLVDRKIAEAKAVGADVDLAEEEVKAARVLLDQGLPDKAVEKATNAIKLADQAKKQYYSYGVRYTIKTVEKIIASIKELGVSTEEPEGMLKESKVALGHEDYEKAEELAKMAERIALYTEEKAEEISAGLRRLDGMMTKAKSEGRDISAAEGLVEKAREIAKKGNYGNSLEHLREAERSLLEEQVSSVSEGLKEEPAEEPVRPGPPPPVVEEPVAPPPVQRPVEQVQQPEPQAMGASGPIHYPAPEPKYEPQPPTPPPQPQEPAGQRFRCPYCGSVFEVRAPYRPVTTSCPYCQHMVVIN